jgi:hypothetical protein
LSCSREPERSPETTAAAKLPEDTPTPEHEELKPAKKDETPEVVEPQEKGSKQEDRLWPDNPLAKEVLTDPYDKTKSCSYWADAREGDWVRFLNHRKNVIIFTVLKREDNIIKLGVREYTREGKEIPDKKNDTREVDVEEDDRLMRSPITTRYAERYVSQWKLYGSNKVLNCERRWIPNPLTGDSSDTYRSKDVRCGGLVFYRRKNTEYVILIDYGDAEHPPEWSHLNPKELLTYWYKFHRSVNPRRVPQEDPPGGEPPEAPEPEKESSRKKTREEVIAGFVAVIESVPPWYIGTWHPESKWGKYGEKEKKALADAAREIQRYYLPRTHPAEGTPFPELREAITRCLRKHPAHKSETSGKIYLLLDMVFDDGQQYPLVFNEEGKLDRVVKMLPITGRWDPLALFDNYTRECGFRRIK